MLDLLGLVPEKGAGLELFKFVLNLILLLITWTLGRWLVFIWEDRRKIIEQERDKLVEDRRRIWEISRDLRRKFHDLFGEFKSNVRLWSIAKKPSDPKKHPKLLEQIVKGEGMVEALISDIATVKQLHENEVTTLGLFRQGYQTIRQALTKVDRTDRVPAFYDTAPYNLFNDVATKVSRIIVEDREEPDAETAQQNVKGVMDVRSDVWNEAIQCKEKKQSWETLIKIATKKRRHPTAE